LPPTRSDAAAPAVAAGTFRQTSSVSTAITKEDGFGRAFLRAASGLDPELFETASAGLRAIQSSLANQQATYWIYQLEKPGRRS